jgi:hypothetical protein
MDKNPFIPSERAMDRKESARSLKNEDKRHFAEERAELSRHQGPSRNSEPDVPADTDRDFDLDRDRDVGYDDGDTTLPGVVAPDYVDDTR